MNISSITKNSLLDFPGKISAIIGTQGCNMRCPWCHNFFLIPYAFTRHSRRINEKDVYRFLDQRRDLLEGIVITGGEPTIQSDLPLFCEKIKKLGFAVKIDTNGTNPGMLSCLLENNLVDYIAMDIKTDLDQYHLLFREDLDTRDITKSIETVMSSNIPYQFRTTCIAPFVTLYNIDQIGKLIQGAKSFYLQKCHPVENNHKPENFEILNDNRLLELKRKASDYVVNCQVR